MIWRTFDQIEQRYLELQDKTLKERLPQYLNQWLPIFNHQILDNLPAGVALLDRGFILRAQNLRYKDYLNTYSPVKPDKAIGKCYFENVPGTEKQLGNWFREARDNHRADTQYDFELRIERENNEILTYWDAVISPVLDIKGNTHGILIFCLDVTQKFNAINSAEQYKDKLNQAKSTITTLLDLKEEINSDLEKRFTLNAGDLLLPLIERLQSSNLNREQRHILTLIESTVIDITTKFCSKLNSPSFRLTPREILVAFLIKTGRTSKEISDMLSVSTASIEFHRANIRKKLGLTNNKSNLRSFLLSL